MNNIEFKVRVNCLTYNHSSLIMKAMDGFCMPETNFPFICVIVDDASTDGEQEVISRYLEDRFDMDNKSVGCKEETDDYYHILAQHKNNKNCFFSVYYLKYNHFSIKKTKRVYFDSAYEVKYIAMCEGDDFWIHPNKLKIQVDYLEAHPNSSGCIHAYRRDCFQGEVVSSKEIHKYQQTVDVIPPEEVICGKGQFCATASWVYRASAVVDYPDWAKRAPVGDKPLKLVLFTRGSIGYIDEVMSVYQVGVPGSWTTRVFRDRKAEKILRQGLISIINDFDDWTNGKYHKFVKRNLLYYKYACWKTDFVLQPYAWLKQIIHF